MCLHSGSLVKHHRRMHRIYKTFYLLGRDDIAKADIEIDLDGTIEKVMEGADMHATTLEICKAALVASANRKAFVTENKQEISAAGGDEELAWREYEMGRLDGLRAAMEEDVVEAMYDETDPEEDEDDDEEDDEENPDEEDDDDDDDDEDEDDDVEDEDDDEEEGEDDEGEEE